MYLVFDTSLNTISIVCLGLLFITIGFADDRKAKYLPAVSDERNNTASTA